MQIFHIMDSFDARLLAELQRRADITAQELSDVLNLSSSQAARRRARLERDGVIAGDRARLDPGKLGLSVQAFVQVQIAAHSSELRPPRGNAAGGGGMLNGDR